MSAALQCPSYFARADARVLGRVRPDGTAGFIAPPLLVTEDFLTLNSQRGREPEHHWRFTGPCHQHLCAQWTGAACGLIDRLMSEAGDLDSPATTACAIRAACRWHHQRGDAACVLCPLITRLTPQEV